MNGRSRSPLALVGAICLALLPVPGAPACCPASPTGKPVVNADQAVIIIWDAAAKTQHFIRKASFKSAADDFGFLVPTPTEPDLNESGNEAFPYLQKLTEPERRTIWQFHTIGCGLKSKSPKGRDQFAVNVRAEKEVAGFKAVVLETRSASALVDWLGKNGYAFSPEVEAWAKPYVAAGWLITALKVATDAAGKRKVVDAAALRMTFKTDRPLFPYREPDFRSAADALGASHRLLRIYFIAEARYQGELTEAVPWTGRVAWANLLSAEDRMKALELLNLPEQTGPSQWWMTEFEDRWPYQVAPADVVFSRNANQAVVAREPIIEYVTIPLPEIAVLGIGGFILFLILVRFFRRRALPAPGDGK